MAQYKRIASATNINVGGTGSHTELWGVVVGTGAAGSLTISEGTASGGNTVTTINTAAAATYNFWGLRSQNGFYIVNSATADCTVVYK